MNLQDLQAIDDRGLLLRRQDLVGELTSLKFRQATQQLTDTAAIGRTRRDLARVETVIRAREIERGLGKGELISSTKLEAGSSAANAFRRAMRPGGEG